MQTLVSASYESPVPFLHSLQRRRRGSAEGEDADGGNMVSFPMWIISMGGGRSEDIDSQY